MIKTFTIATGNIDSQNDKIILSGIKIPERKVIVTRDFNRSYPPAGIVENVFVDGNELKAVADIPDEFNDCYPAIGFDLLKYSEENGVRIIHEFKLREVSFCSQPNADKSIKTIREQKQEHG